MLLSARVSLWKYLESLITLWFESIADGLPSKFPVAVVKHWPSHLKEGRVEFSSQFKVHPIVADTQMPEAVGHRKERYKWTLLPSPLYPFTQHRIPAREWPLPAVSACVQRDVQAWREKSLPLPSYSLFYRCNKWFFPVEKVNQVNSLEAHLPGGPINSTTNTTIHTIPKLDQMTTIDVPRFTNFSSVSSRSSCCHLSR